MSDKELIIGLLSQLQADVAQLKIRNEIIEERLDEAFERLDFEINDIRGDLNLKPFNAYLC